MPVLTNFLPVEELEQEEVIKQKKYIEKLNNFRETITLMSKTFQIKISKKSDIGKEIIAREQTVFKEFWKEVGVIPETFNFSCLGTKEKFNYLSDLSQYPIVKLSALKNIADILSFGIFPMDYINMDKILSTYGNSSYADKIKNLYNGFKTVVFNCQKYIGTQQLYILAPISFYDPWKEVCSQKNLPKYFSSKLLDLSAILGIIMPSQRNLYHLCQSIKIKREKSEQNEELEKLEELENTMQKNFKIVETSIHTFSNSNHTTKRSISKQIYDECMAAAEAEEEVKAYRAFYFIDDPIIFSVHANYNIFDDTFNEEKTHIGLCFGTDMPINFFLEQGMKPINDKRLEHITHILKK